MQSIGHEAFLELREVVADFVHQELVAHLAKVDAPELQLGIHVGAQSVFHVQLLNLVTDGAHGACSRRA